MRWSSSKDLKASFDTFREDGRGSNFADAVALTQLYLLIQEYREGLGKSLPRFFVSSKILGEKPTFLKVVEHANMQEDFSYERPNGKKYSIFREADYFVFRASVRFDLTESSSEKGPDIFRNPNDLRNLQAHIDRLLDERATTITPEDVDRIFAGEYTLNQLLNGLNNFSFFQNVWEPGSRLDEETFLQDLQETIEQLDSEEFKQMVAKAKEEFQAELKHWIESYEFMESLWLQMEKATANLRRVQIERDIDYFRDFGLLRFAFPESSHQKINNVLEKLMRSGGRDDNVPQYDVIAACFWAVEQSENHDLDNLAAATSALWVANKYWGITNLLKRISPLPHFSLSLIYAAALLESNQDGKRKGIESFKVIKRGQKILKQLTEIYTTIGDAKNKSDLAVGIAYLNFHLWAGRGNYPLWSPPSIQKKKCNPNDHIIIKEAIRFAKEAFEQLDENNIKKKVYALNQYIYYLVMGGNEGDKELMDKLVGELMTYRQNEPESWQYRFDDTIARYFHRLVVDSNNTVDKSTYLQMAVTYSGYACTDAPWDRSVCDYHTKLLSLKSNTEKPTQAT